MNEFKETLSVWDSMLFQEETMNPILCKPKLLPMKTITMEKLEKMQREAERQMKEAEETEKNATAVNGRDSSDTSAPESEKPAEVWSADD